MKHRKVFHWPRFHIKFTEGLFLHLNSFALLKVKLQSFFANTKGERNTTKSDVKAWV